MNHEVFICYDPKDEEISTDISNLFESNNIKTWVKSKDYGEDDSVHVISDAIRASDAFVLIYSENSKNSNFVKTEIDIAFSSNVPILIYKIDESGIDEKLGFYLKDKPTIESFNPKEKYPVLLNDVAGILNKTVDVKPDASEISIPSMNHVFICYDENDEDTANGICHTLEQNYIRCWIKNRDLGVNESVYNIKENIESADAVVETLIKEIKTLAQKYAISYHELNDQLVSAQNELSGLISQLEGDESSIDGLNALMNSFKD